MDTYYTRIGVDPTASQEEIETAYQRKRDSYSTERVADMGDEFRHTAQQRLAELEEAYQTLSDPQQRHAYNQRIAGIPATEPARNSPQRPPASRERWFAIGGAIVGLLLVGVIWFVTDKTQADAPAAPAVHRPAPDFTLATPDGQEIRLSDYHGKIVLVNFWGTWCDPCIRELPALQSAYAQLEDEGFVVIGVNLFDNEQSQNHTEEDIQAFIEDKGITYPVVLDTHGNVTDSYRVFPIPTSFFVDANGNIRYVLPRELTAEEITAWFTELKQETMALYEKQE